MTVFVKLFCFDICKIVDSEYSMDIYKSVKIGTVMESPEMLQFVPDYLETNKMCKHAVKKLPF